MEPAAKYCVVPDDFVDVDIIQVNNCRNFFLCLDRNVAMDLSECVDTYYNAIEPKPVSEIQINHFYSVHNQEDQKYYRGQVLAQAFQENLFWVRLIDCGRIQAIPAMGIFTLVPHYVTNNFPISVLNCFISESWNKDCMLMEASFFAKFYQNPQSQSIKVKAKFGTPTSDHYPVTLLFKLDENSNWTNLSDCQFKDVTLPVDLEHRRFTFSKIYSDPKFAFTDENIKCFQQFCQTLTNKQPLLKMDHEYSAICPFVGTVTKLICIIQSYGSSGTSDPDHFTTNLTQFYGNYPKCGNEMKSLMVFRYNDFYFRGFVVQCYDKERFCVLSIDYAFLLDVAIKDTYPLMDLFSLDKFPPFAHLCALDNIFPASKVWSRNAIEMVRNWTGNLKMLTITPKLFLGVYNNFYTVDMKLDGEMVAKRLLRDKYCLEMEPILNDEDWLFYFE